MGRSIRRTVLGCAVGLAVGGTWAEASASPTAATDAARELLLLSRNLERSERVLYVTAHPDDEDARLISRLVHGDGAEVALLCLTRGEGGQNEIGTELFHALGVVRSRELEAAGTYTGATLYFSRAYEFGYSFSVEETFDKWGRDAILRDVVQVVREFRPDVMLTMLVDGPGGGQHHQASAQIAIEAFDVAASTRWPELGPAHATSRLFRQIWNDDESVTNACDIDVGGFDPILGATHAAVGAASRAQHKCQGMARLTDPIATGISRWEFLLGRSGDEPRPVPSFFPESVSVVRDLAPSTPFLEQIRREPSQPAGWLGLWTQIDDLRSRVRLDATGNVRVNALSERIALGLEHSLGIEVVAAVDRRSLVAGDEVPVRIDVVRADGPDDAAMQFALESTAGNAVSFVGPDGPRALPRGPVVTVDATLVVADDAEPTVPRPVPAHGDSVPANEAERYIRPHWRSFELRPTLVLEGKSIPLASVPLRAAEVDPEFPRVVHGDVRVVPDPSVRPARDAVAVPVSEDSRSARIVVHVSSVAGGPVSVRAEAPMGWRVTPSEIELETLPGGVERPVTVAVEALADELQPSELRFTARRVGDDDAAPSSAGVLRVEYPHIRPDGLWVDAAVELVPVPCVVPTGARVGLVEGAGDRMDEALDTLGIPFTWITRDDLDAGGFSAFDVIISGVRAYKVRDDLKAAHDRLMEWVVAGGVWIVQYNKFEFNAGSEVESPYAPYPGTTVGRRRVTVEESPVVVNLPDHPVFLEPNTIGPNDWEGWVQERGLYFLDFDDPRYEDLITLEDPWPKNAGPKGGALVSTEIGRGRWVYVGVGLFRQLPAAVPGAYRLLANLVALGER